MSWIESWNWQVWPRPVEGDWDGPPVCHGGGGGEGEVGEVGEEATAWEGVGACGGFPRRW